MESFFCYLWLYIYSASRHFGYSSIFLAPSMLAKVFASQKIMYIKHCIGFNCCSQLVLYIYITDFTWQLFQHILSCSWQALLISRMKRRGQPYMLQHIVERVTALAFLLLMVGFSHQITTLNYSFTLSWRVITVQLWRDFVHAWR